MSPPYAAVLCGLLLMACEARGFDVHPLQHADRNELPIKVEPPVDALLEHRLRAIYAQIGGLGDVSVRVAAGVVHLGGVTEDLVVEQRAVAIAQRLEHVVYVSSAIKTGPSERLLASTWRTVRNLGGAVLDLVPKLAVAILVFLPFQFLAAALGRWRRPLHRVGARQLTGSLVRFAVRGVIIVVGLLVSLEILGIVGVVVAVVGTLGVVGLAVGIVLKDWVANFFPALMLGVRPPFKAGDLVRVGEQEGRVVEITPRATVLMTTDGERARLPNSFIFQQTLINFSHHRERRLRCRMALSHRAHLVTAETVGCHALLHVDGVLSDPPPFMRTNAVAPGVVEIEFFAWIDQDAVNFRTAESRARRAVLEALLQADVPLAEQEVLVRAEREHVEAAAPAEDAHVAEKRDEEFVKQQLDRAIVEASDGERAHRERPTT